MLRSGSYLVAAAMAFAIVTGVSSGCDSAADKSYEGHGISFRYPRSWEQASFAGAGDENPNGLWTEAFRPHSPSSRADMIFISEFRTPASITKQNRARYREEVASSVSNGAIRAGGSLLAGPTPVSMGGLPGYGFRISSRTRDNRSSRSRILLVWNGRSEYLLDCRYDAAGGDEVEIERTCNEIIESFELS
jgi:hypothetical protein